MSTKEEKDKKRKDFKDKIVLDMVTEANKDFDSAVVTEGEYYTTIETGGVEGDNVPVSIIIKVGK